MGALCDWILTTGRFGPHVRTRNGQHMSNWRQPCWPTLFVFVLFGLFVWPFFRLVRFGMFARLSVFVCMVGLFAGLFVFVFVPVPGCARLVWFGSVCLFVGW